MLAHAHCLGGYECFAPLDARFDSLAVKLCLFSEFMAAAAAVSLFVSLLLSTIFNFFSFGRHKSSC